jgi:hypothetical protein
MRDSQYIKVNYFPWTETILFALAIIGTSVCLYILEINAWFMIPAVIFSYAMTMREASIIVIDDDRMKIMSFNYSIGIQSIPLSSINKINSTQTLDDDTYEVYGAPYLTLNRGYELEYIDTKGKTRKVEFKISNVRKEKLIMEALKFK